MSKQSAKEKADKLERALNVLNSSTFVLNQDNAGGTVAALEVVLEAAKARLAHLRKYAEEET